MVKQSPEDVVDAVAPLGENEETMENDMELDVTSVEMEHQLLEEEEEALLEGAEEVEVEYVDDNGIPVPEMAEEVVMEGDYVEEYLEEPMQEDDMAESLVALSRSGEFREKTEGDYVVENIETRRKTPRILRRFAPQHQQFVEQQHSFSDSGRILVDEYQPVASAGRDTRFTPKFPVAVARRAITPSTGGYQKQDWREDQCKKLLVCDVLESLPEHKQDSFKRLMNIMGTNGYYQDVEADSVSPRQNQKPASRYEARFTEQPRYVVTSSPSSRNARVVAMIPFEEKVNAENAERTDTSDMPELIQSEIHEAERSVDNDVDETGEVDIETYEEDSPREHRKTVWLDNKGRVLDYEVVPGRGYGEEGYVSPEQRSHNASHPKECHERLGTLERLCEHMYQVHRAPTDIKRKIFENESQFEDFLRELESRGGNFRMSRGNKTIKEGIVQYFRCNRIFSIAKDKALRIVDDISAGTYEAVKDITQPMDPFGKETSTKPYLRTEEACTAFFRKTYMNDGTIEVRYCDYHLHGDERLRLPAAIRNRIFEMTRKRLPLPVIVMVLQRECNRFCLPGTALERRIMAVTPREVQLVAQSVQRRLDAASKRKRAGDGSGGIPNSHDGRNDDREREDHEAAENIIEHGEDQDGHDITNEHLMDLHEEHTEGGEVGDDYSGEGRGEGGELTEVELATLEEYEQNRGVILTDFQSIKREENRKRGPSACRLCRERVRAKIYTLGRAMRNIQFSDFECDLLIRSEQMLENIVELWNARMELSCKINANANENKQTAKRELLERFEESSKAEGASRNSECSAESTSDVIPTSNLIPNATPEASVEPETQAEVELQPEPVENRHHTPPSVEPESTPSPVTQNSSKTKSKTKVRRASRLDKQVKEENSSKPPTPSSSPPAQPAVSRLGRMRFFTLLFTILAVLGTSILVSAFNVPPTGLCKVGSGGDCIRCDCNKPLSCYKGTCR
ncbi:unnamed protein product [Nippostrongylus brasiliensis]|uniref:C2H2-type domain-containing protein n=1 Tax=Nippostrongylus brasiliensis TaxID=27835 RepID=A0A158QXC6_NIPBR|nr:unnamed protein product [Nippostrongylus brasiliensis]